MWLNNDHACLFYWFNLLLVVIVYSQVKLILFAESTNYTHNISSLNPKLHCPSADKSHSEQNWALDEANQDWLTVLIHGWAQFELHHRTIIGLALVKLYSEETIGKELTLKVVLIGLHNLLFFLVGLCNHRA